MKEQIFQQATANMEKAIKAFQNEVSRLRTGRASISILDDIRVDYYGQMVPINQVGTMGVPEPRLITVSPWEQKLIPAIEKAIEKANLGLTPINDGKLIRIPIPALTTERRLELVKTLKTYGEDGKVAIRQVRREAMESLKKLEKDGKLSEDDSKKAAAHVQKITDDFTAKVDEAVAKKEADILQV